MNSDTRSKALDESTRWFARLRSDTVSEREREEFERWRDASLANRRAYEELQGLWDSMDGLDAAPAPRPSKSRMAAFSLAGAMAAAVAWFLIAMVAALPPFAPDVYETAAGEQRSLPLADGSTVHLNTRTRVAVDLSDDARHVRMDSGEALFDIAADPDRPFIIDTGTGEIRVLGTRFNVRRRAGSTEVAVIEGKVRVAASNTGVTRGAPASADLTAGQLVQMGADGLSGISAINPGLIASWRDGRLVYRGVPLSEVVSDLNRYLDNGIRIGDSELEALTVTAVIRIEDRESILAALDRSLPLRTVSLASGVTMLYADPAS